MPLPLRLAMSAPSIAVPSSRSLALVAPLRRLTLAVLGAVALLGAPAVLAQSDGVNVQRGGGAVSQLVPAEAIEQQAAQEYEQIKQEARAKGALAPSNDPRLARLRTISERILPQAARWNDRAKAWKWEVNLIKAKQVNAFCMPGGKIAVYTGFLDQIKPTDDELAMVIGHEIAHALQEHARERAAKAEITNLGANVISQLFGFGNLGNLALGTGAHLLTLKFSRSDETEADLVGMDIAARAGYDPRAAVTLWQKMGKVSQSSAAGASMDFLSTHPSGQSRIAELQRHMPEVLPLYARAIGTTVERLPAYRTNMGGLANAPVDRGDEDKQQPLKR